MIKAFLKKKLIGLLFIAIGGCWVF